MAPSNPAKDTSWSLPNSNPIFVGTGIGDAGTSSSAVATGANSLLSDPASGVTSQIDTSAAYLVAMSDDHTSATPTETMNQHGRPSDSPSNPRRGTSEP